MTPGSKLVAIERNEGMFKVLARRINDPRLFLHNDSAANVKETLLTHRLANADYVISGIPFSLFPVELTREIVAATSSALTANGEFLVYQCLWTNKQRLIVNELKSRFSELDEKSVPLNIPPLTVFRAKKPLR